MILRRRDYLSEAEETEWVVRVEDRRVQWSAAVYNRLFGRENVARGMAYSIVKAISAEEAIEKFCQDKKVKSFYFEAVPKTGKFKDPK